MKKPVITIIILFLIVAGLAAVYSLINDSTTTTGETNSYNILFILTDDQNAWANSLEDPGIKTPNMDRLARKSMVFSRAYTAAPACAPSRSSLLTGVHPATSGVYYNFQNYREADHWIADVVNMPGLFKDNDYLTAGYGKVFHHRYQEDDISSWSDGYFVGFEVEQDYALKEHALWTKEAVSHPMWHYGPLPDTYDRNNQDRMQQDTRNTSRVISLLEEQHDQPFFISLGLWKPHGPWYVPKRFFNMYPTEEISLPPGYKDGDVNDLPEAAKWLAMHRGYQDKITSKGLWRDTMQAYFASVSYVDDQIGRVLDALEDSPNRENTIIVFSSDHGFHLGEKNHWSKFALWDHASRTPFMISVPGLTEPAVHNAPVSLLDIFPTLVELCGLGGPPTHDLDGVSLASLLRGETSERGKPVVSTHGRNNHAVRTADYTYIRYRNGAEELYNHSQDPHEWTNLAEDSGYTDVKTRLAKHLPQENAPNMQRKDGTKTGEDWDEEVFENSYRWEASN